MEERVGGLNQNVSVSVKKGHGGLRRERNTFVPGGEKIIK
jgi:hypothetical protein